MLMYQYWQAQEVKLEKDAKEMVESFKRDIEKQEELHKKLSMMRDHSEWFETTSPKEYGMKLMKLKNKRK
jgi:hypothetical protein